MRSAAAVGVLLLPLLVPWTFACVEPTTGLDGGQPAPCTSTPRIDTLFVVDNTSTMGPKHRQLMDAMPRYLSALQAACADYRIAIVSMDVDSPGGERTGQASVHFAGPPYFEVLQNDGRDCRSAGIEHGCARGVVSSSQPPTEQIEGISSALESLGTCGSGIESGFASIHEFFARASACNSSFAREGSRVVIIMVSDEDESGEGTIESTVSSLLRLGAERVRVGAIIGGKVEADKFVPGNCGESEGPCGQLCSSDPPMGSHADCRGPKSCADGERCSALNQCTTFAEDFWRYCDWCSFFNAPGCCNSLPGTRFAALVEAMEAQNFGAVPASRAPSCPTGMSANCRLASACDPDWGDTLERFAQTLALSP